MAEYSSLLHAQHNERICNELNANHENSDWVITVAFYSALHYSDACIFPHEFTHAGKKLKADDFNKYCVLIGEPGKKHKLRRSLVEKCLPEDIASAYNQLLDVSWTARYHRYKYSTKVSDLSRRQLVAIRNYHTRIKVKAASASDETKP
jgi:hypothetical protein